MNYGLLESFPISVIYLGITLLMLAFCEVGFRLGVRERTQRDEDAPVSLAPIVGGLLGMLGLLLAFTFSMAASQHELRKQNVLSEANAVGTAYLRADLLDKQYGSEVKSLLREYVNIRLEAISAGNLSDALARSAEIHELLWDHVSSASVATPSINTSLVIQSINEVIDLNQKRVTAALHLRIPVSVWIALTAITALTMLTMGIQIGVAGKRRLASVIPLSLAFAVLVTLVVDLNRPQNGLITVGQHAIVDLQKSMEREAK